MTHTHYPGPGASCASLLLVAARCTPGWGVVYLADPATRLPWAERLKLRWPPAGHNPTILAATPAQLLRVLWRTAVRMGWRYLVAALIVLAVGALRGFAPATAAWVATLMPRRSVLVVVSKQLLPATSPAQPLPGRFRRPLLALANYGHTVAIHLFLTVTSGEPDQPVNLGRAGARLQEVGLEEAAAAAQSLAGGRPRPGRR
jgi:hypothetical protein